MELFDSTFTALNRAMGAAGLRQETLANNLSNVNTPGYKRLDVSFEQSLAEAVDAAKMGDSSKLDGLHATVHQDANVALRADGNSVDVDQEMAFLAENNVQYNALIQLSQKKLQTLKYVISEGRR